MKQRSKWLLAIGETIVKYRDGNFTGYVQGCSMCELASQNLKADVADTRFKQCEQCVMKCSDRVQDMKRCYCSDMFTYPNMGRTELCVKRDIKRRMEFWRRATILFRNTPAYRFEPAVIRRKDVPFPELWELDREILVMKGWKHDH